MSKRLDLTGQRFGCRVVLENTVPGRRGFALCLCDCGATSTVFKSGLKKKRPKHCQLCRPCINKENPGRAALRGIHYMMLDRTTNPKNKDWHHYGGRGIEVCPEWRESFEQFCLDMGPRPKGHKVERYDNDGPYAPWNCGWEPQSVQVRNKRTNVYVTYDGKRMVLADAEKLAGFKANVVLSRYHRGWPEEHLFKPVGFRIVSTQEASRRAGASQAKVFTTYQGQRMSLKDACRLAGVRYGSAHQRRRRGLPESEWLTPRQASR